MAIDLRCFFGVMQTCIMWLIGWFSGSSHHPTLMFWMDYTHNGMVFFQVLNLVAKSKNCPRRAVFSARWLKGIQRYISRFFNVPRFVWICGIFTNFQRETFFFFVGKMEDKEPPLPRILRLEISCFILDIEFFCSRIACLRLVPDKSRDPLRNAICEGHRTQEVANSIKTTWW